MKNRIKLYLQFIYYVLFGKSNFRLPLTKRCKYAFKRGFTVNQVHLYNLESNNSGEYLSEYDWFKSRSINGPYDVVLNNKFLTYELIKDKIQSPKIYAVKLNGHLRILMQDVNDVLEIIKNAHNVIVKPAMSGKGRGVYKISNDHERFYVNGKLKTETAILEFLSQNDNWIICQAVKQHKYASDIYPNSVNTIRLVVIKDDDDYPMITCAVHRFGTSETGVVDNASKGGIVSNIDLETGIISEAKSIKKLGIYSTHPDTGIVIQNTAIPFWEETKQKILEISSELPYLKLIAWDVVITENGPCIIEGNSSSGVNILQLWGGLRKKDFGKYLIKHGVIN